MDCMEKRAETRFRINQLIGYFPNREEYLWAEGLNLSEGGMQCSSKEALEPMTNVFLMIGVPSDEGERLVRCEGHVTWSHMDGERCIFGIRFDHIAEEDEGYFRAYFDRLEPDLSSLPPTD